MLHKLIKKVGKSKPVIDMIDTLSKVNDRLKTLRKSYRGKKAEFEVIPADENETKFRKDPIDGSWRGGDYSRGPKKA